MATGKHVNITDVTFQLNGSGSLLPIVGAKEATIDDGVQVIKDSGDADVYMSVASAVGFDPTITLSSNGAFQLLTVSSGAKGTLAFKVPDSFSGTAAAGGGYSVSVTNAIIDKRVKQFGHRRFAGLNLGFSTFSPDGVTSPITYTAL